jgi:hypothetical protein
MKIIIDDEQPVALIREQFNRMFPYLKLEFFPRLHAPGSTSGLKHRQPWSSKIGEIRNMKNTGEIIIVPEMSTQTLEQLFGKYGIGVQVFRRFGNTWLETAGTDRWTLQRQNEQGRQDSLLNKPCPETHKQVT